ANARKEPLSPGTKQVIGLARARPSGEPTPVGLYLDPAAYAVVLVLDEMSQIQTLDRTQSMKPGRSGTMTQRRCPGAKSSTPTVDNYAVQSIPDVGKWLQARPYRTCVEGSLAAMLAATTLQFNRDLTKCRPFAEICSRRGA